jgi:hypothetical protein
MAYWTGGETWTRDLEPVTALGSCPAASGYKLRRGATVAVWPQGGVGGHKSAIHFLFLWLLVAAVVSLIGGWYLAGRGLSHAATFNAAKWRMQSGRMRWLANYNNVLTMEPVIFDARAE